MIEKLLERQRAAKAKAAQADAQAEPSEANGTPFQGYGACDPADTVVERQIDPDPTGRPAHVTRPKASFFDDAPLYNALGLRSGSLAGVFSTHRPAPDTKAIAAQRQEQESRAWRGFEAMLNLFNLKR